MSPETRDFLNLVRKAEGPTAGDESRVLTALEATLAGSLSSAAAEVAPAAKGVAPAAGFGLKAFGSVLGVSVCAALVAAALSGTAEPQVASPARRAPVSQAPLRSSAPAVASAMPFASASATSPAASSPKGAQQAPATAGSAAVGAASLRQELALLSGVQSALERADGAEALRQLDRHATGDRQFVAERRAARISALCLLGRVAEAQQLGAVFLRENAQSVQRTAVERSCAATKPEKP
jgi:hypothetical protein